LSSCRDELDLKLAETEKVSENSDKNNAFIQSSDQGVGARSCGRWDFVANSMIAQRTGLLLFGRFLSSGVRVKP
jgi:hypothetical protein